MNIDLIEKRRARRTDPDTSKAAAKRAERFANSHAGRILAVFEQHGGLWTADDLAQFLCLQIVQIDRRLHEIPQIERTGAVRDGFTVWHLKVQHDGGRDPQRGFV